MKFKEYEEQLAQWDLYPPSDYQKLFYTIGFSGEMFEFLEKYFTEFENYDEQITYTKDDIKNECGDALWYLTRLFNAFDMSLTLVEDASYWAIKHEVTVVNTAKYCKNIIESVKKLYRDKEGKVSAEFVFMLSVNYTMLFRELRILLARFNLSIEDCMDANVEKLSSRKARGKLHGDGDKR